MRSEGFCIKIFQMTNFNSEVWDPVFLKSNSFSKKIYKIFSENEENVVLAYKKQLPSDSDWSEEDEGSDNFSHHSDFPEKHSTLRKLSSKQPSIFSLQKVEESEYSSEEDTQSKKSSVDLIRDFLHLYKKNNKKNLKKAFPLDGLVEEKLTLSAEKQTKALERSESNLQNDIPSTTITISSPISDVQKPQREIKIIESSDAETDRDFKFDRHKQLSRSGSEISFNEKYGSTNNILGKGSFATVKLCCLLGSDEKFAVKEFRKRRREESKKDYIKKLNAEFCIAASLDHENLVKSFDLIQDDKHQWCVVMEYCPGGDLFSHISNNLLTKESERSCYFVQLCHGVQYLHSIGVAHRELKPGYFFFNCRKSPFRCQLPYPQNNRFRSI